LFLGIDIGTSGVKAVLVNEDGVVTDTASTSLNISRPHLKWSEQEPEDWWTATCAAVAKLDRAARARVRGIGLSGQMHSATLLDAADQVIWPAILWNDGRSADESRDLQASEPDFVSKTGNLVMPGFTAPKLAWLRKHEPSHFAEVAKVLLPKDYIRLKMTGEYASDMSDSAGTSWMDVENRKWHTPLLAACGLDESHMPKLYEGTEETGRLRPDIAKSWGMESVSVYAGGGDNAAGAIGAGIYKDGDTMMSLGTSGVIFCAGDSYRANPGDAVHAFCHALPQRWHLMSVMLSAASCLDWACRMTGTATVADLIAMAQTSSPQNSQTLFLPYLSGERTPHNNPDAQGVLFGLGHDTGPAEIAQSVLEGVAFGMAQGLDALRQAGAQIEAISVIGGGSQSSHWGKILASALNTPLVYRESAAVGPAFGAARLAQYGAAGGAFDDVFKAPAIVQDIAPDAELADHYTDKRARFAALYQTLKPRFSGH